MTSLQIKIYNDLIDFHHQRFDTWATGVMELLNDLKLDITMNTKSFALNCKHAVRNKSVAVWNNNSPDSLTNPVLRTYKVFKGDFIIPEIERGHHANPKPPLLRDCVIFATKLIEDEKHFLMHCSINARDRDDFFEKKNKIEMRMILDT